MRILFVIDSLRSGGAQRQLINLALALTVRGHKIEFFLYYPEYEHFTNVIKNANIIVNTCKKTNRFSIDVVFALRRLMRIGKFDVVLSFLDTPNFYVELASIGMSTLPIVVSERFMYTSESLPWGRWLLQQGHRLAKHVTVNSHHQRERMERMFPWIQGKISTIYNGVDLEKFSPRPSSQKSGSDLKFLVVSSIVAKKNAVNLIRAISIYMKEYGNVCTVHWAGEVPNDSLSQRAFEEAQQLITSLNLESHWVWLGVRTDIPELLRNCDALIHPSFYEGLPNAICEALACGCPVLASNVCDNPRLVQDGVTGILFDPADSNSIVDAIYRFSILSPENRFTMMKQARKFAENNLSVDRYADQYESLFFNLIN